MGERANTRIRESGGTLQGGASQRPSALAAPLFVCCCVPQLYPVTTPIGEQFRIALSTKETTLVASRLLPRRSLTSHGRLERARRAARIPRRRVRFLRGRAARSGELGSCGSVIKPISSWRRATGDSKLNEECASCPCPISTNYEHASEAPFHWVTQRNETSFHRVTAASSPIIRFARVKASGARVVV